MGKVSIRKMQITDVERIIEIEKVSFATPWTYDIFYHELIENHYAHYYVIEWEGIVVGYAGMWVVIDETQITNIVILPEYRGKQLGKRLFQHMLSTAITHGTKQLSLEVRKSNIIAQEMYAKFGLVPGGIRKNYYTDNQEDAIVMWVNFNE